MATRYFTPEEANRALVTVKPLAERMIEHRRALAEAQQRQAELAARIAGNGGGIEARELEAFQRRVEAAAAGLARCIEAIHEIGAIVKDIDRGLVDFPARRGGEEVLLCWRLGEQEIEYWHGLDEGFAGRKSLPL